MTLYAIGDIQGCAGRFNALLDAISFEPVRDRLWLAGDLVNRGPDSLGVLRRVIALGDSVTAVLGNHDLHLLAAAAGIRRPDAKDTFDDILGAPDAAELLEWLRNRPLLHHDAGAGRLLVHAGLPPGWSVGEAKRRAEEVCQRLRSPAWAEGLADMYGDEPRAWSGRLAPQDRRRYTINALTRMRFCDYRGELDFENTGPPGTQPSGLIPWFDFPRRKNRDTHIVFGHWAALGLLRRPDVTALDTGCVWGGSLTAVALDPPAEPVSIDCCESALRSARVSPPL
jgi:bis(5'-nucleosyl)-tetraphosphatase (symmetrical)